jgi:hypothetical protein
MSAAESARRDEYVRAVVATFPPLTQAQRARVAGLLAPAAPTARGFARKARKS